MKRLKLLPPNTLLSQSKSEEILKFWFGSKDRCVLVVVLSCCFCSCFCSCGSSSCCSCSSCCCSCCLYPSFSSLCSFLLVSPFSCSKDFGKMARWWFNSTKEKDEEIKEKFLHCFDGIFFVCAVFCLLSFFVSSVSIYSTCSKILVI